MSKIRVGINGMGRIGRTILREICCQKNSKIEVLAVNNPGRVEEFVHLIKYDSVHGKFQGSIRYSKQDNTLHLNQYSVAFHSHSDPSEIPWSDQKIDIVIDSTGIFKDRNRLAAHLNGTVKKVIMCAPGEDLDGTFVIGINHQTYDPTKHHIVSNASCTTNCLAPLTKVLHDHFGIVSGFMTTVHSYTGDQMLLDGYHSDPRRARAAALSMIPTTTGAAKTVGLVIPDLKGKLDGYAVRVPTPNVSLVDFTAVLKKTATAQEINSALKQASEGELKGILAYEEAHLVSCDFIGMKESSCLDASLTNVIGNMAKIVAWYDNEIGFSNRVIDLIRYMGERL